MTAAGRLQAAMDMFNNGLLCGCRQTEWVGDADRECYEWVLIHEEGCEGKDEVLKLLDYGKVEG